MRKCIFLNNSQLFLAIFIIFSLKTRPAQAKGKARLSFRLAQAVCASAVKFAASNQIGLPLQFPSVKDVPCKTLTWNKCETNVDAACLKFSLKHCSTSSNQLKPRKLKIVKKKNKRRKGTRIVNGTNAMPYEFPYQVQITEEGYHLCGGTILNEDYILTAAHCFFELDGSLSNGTLVQVIAGQHNTGEEGGVEQVRIAKTQIIHEHYDLDTSENDIALILLNYALALTRRVQPAFMPPPNHDATGQIAIVTGWGHNETNGSFSDILQKVELPIISNEDCNKAYNRPNDSFVPDTAFCTHYPGGGKDSCQGDSGGPVSLKVKDGSYMVIGVVSYGDDCASPVFPGVNTKVSKYIDWIQSNVA